MFMSDQDHVCTLNEVSNQWGKKTKLNEIEAETEIKTEITKAELKLECFPIFSFLGAMEN